VPVDHHNLARFQTGFLRQLYGQPGQMELTPAADTVEAGLNAYRGSLYGGLSQALQQIYPVCRAFVGETFFDAMAERYISRYPSRVDRLDDYGESFAEFLACFEPVQTLPQLPALARLEWAWHRAFHSADTEPFDFARFGEACQQNSAAIHFRLAPELTLLSEDYAVDLLWQWHHNGAEGDLPELESGPVQLVVFRPGGEVHIERLDLSSWQLLQQLQQDSSLNGLCELLGDTLSVLLPLAVERGWIRGFCS